MTSDGGAHRAAREQGHREAMVLALPAGLLRIRPRRRGSSGGGSGSIGGNAG